MHAVMCRSSSNPSSVLYQWLCRHAIRHSVVCRCTFQLLFLWPVCAKWAGTVS